MDLRPKLCFQVKLVNWPSLHTNLESNFDLRTSAQLGDFGFVQFKQNDGEQRRFEVNTSVLAGAGSIDESVLAIKSGGSTERNGARA